MPNSVCKTSARKLHWRQSCRPFRTSRKKMKDLLHIECICGYIDLTLCNGNKSGSMSVVNVKIKIILSGGRPSIPSHLYNSSSTTHLRDDLQFSTSGTEDLVLSEDAFSTFKFPKYPMCIVFMQNHIRSLNLRIYCRSYVNHSRLK
jgi:hypothetical protein